MHVSAILPSSSKFRLAPSSCPDSTGICYYWLRLASIVFPSPVVRSNITNGPTELFVSHTLRVFPTDDTVVEAVMSSEHAEPFFGITAGDYAAMTPDQQAGIIANHVGKDFILEVSAKVQKNKTTINVLKVHPATSKRARVVKEEPTSGKQKV
jgi:hypothetical protein